MTIQTVYVHMSKARLLQKLYAIPRLAKQDGAPILRRMGAAIFRRIQKAFITKSRGGTDDAGERWRPLSRITILKRLRKKRPTTDRPSSSLTAGQRQQWWAFYRAALARFHEKDIAAKIAWTQLKRVGGVGHFDKYGADAVPILRDTEELLNSLEPGAPKNIFRIKRGEADLGTSRKGARSHHLGIRLPRRRLWPHPSDWPSSWWNEILSDAREGLIEIILDEIR